MDNTFGSVQKDDQGKDEALQNLEENRDISGETGTVYSELKPKKLVKRVSPQHALQVGKRLIKDSFLPSIHSIDNMVPRRVVTLDEKYLRRCLEVIRVNAAKEAECNISANLSSVKTVILSDGLKSSKIKDEDTRDLGRFLLNPLAVGTGEVVLRPIEQCVVSSRPGSWSMTNILKSPLLRKVGALDADQSLNDVKRSISYDFISPGGFSNSFSHKQGSKTPLSKNRNYGSTVHKRLVSVSSTNSTCFDQPFPSTSTNSQGMLHCTWKGGIPYFVFSLDNRREVYVAHLSKEGSARGKGLDYIHVFHSTKGGRKEHGIGDHESYLVGKMKVSTSFSLCPQGSEIMETEFVLFCGNEAFNLEMQTSSHNRSKNKGLPKKVVELFKSSHSSKPRTMSRFQSNSIMEDSSSSPYQDIVNRSVSLDTTNLLEEELSPSLELTAIVVRKHTHKNPLPEVGGWGLKFLRKAGIKQNVDTAETSVPCACSPNTGDCSTSTEILVPAGIHGGLRKGGPSSLIERWRSGGHCDCGGWDLGCPLTVLKARSSKEHCLPSANTSEACELFDFFAQGSKQCSPTLRISNVDDGLYLIHFQSTLSALQSFSIAVAYIHAQSPTSRPRNVKLSR